MSGKDKEAAQEGMRQLKDSLEADSQAMGWLRAVERFDGELRRELATARDVAQRATESAMGLNESLRTTEQQRFKLLQQVEQLTQQVKQLQLSQQPRTIRIEELSYRDRLMRLVPGVDERPTTRVERKQRVAWLKEAVEKYLPEFVRMVEMHGTSKFDMTTLHQDAFASAYTVDEYTLCGMAIKYAGLHGVELHIIGKNGSTLTPKETW
jgi:hypothetical protein